MANYRSGSGQPEGGLARDKQWKEKEQGSREYLEILEVARKLRFCISGEIGRVKESLEAKLATSRHRPILRRLGIPGGPGIRAKKSSCSKKANSPSLR